MVNDMKVNNAITDLNNNTNLFDVVAKIVDKTYQANDKSLFEGFNRGDLVNFVLDGTLPQSNTLIPSDAELIRDIKIMNVGIAIIKNYDGRSYNLTSDFWGSGYGGTHVTDQTKEMLNQKVQTYNNRHSSSNSSQGDGRILIITN
jgi:hypothetical protein